MSETWEYPEEPLEAALERAFGQDGAEPEDGQPGEQKSTQ